MGGRVLSGIFYRGIRKVIRWLFFTFHGLDLGVANRVWIKCVVKANKNTFLNANIYPGNISE